MKRDLVDIEDLLNQDGGFEADSSHSGKLLINELENMLLNSLKKDRQGMDSQIANDEDESKRLAKIIKKLQDKMKEIRD